MSNRKKGYVNTYSIKPGQGHLDKIYSEFVLSTVNFWYDLKCVNPNVLTTMGVIFSILFNYFLIKKKLVLSLVCLFLRQYFDYVDGIFARNFNQTSKFGDYYDHFSDIFIFYIPFIIILLKSKRPLLYTSIALSAGIINSIQLGCVEREYNQNNNKNESPSLFLIEKMCFNPELLKFTDGCVFIIILAIITTIVCLEKD